MVRGAAICLLYALATSAALQTEQIVILGTADSPEYSIGFDLTPSYGVAAVSFTNGTKLPLARADGDEAYLDLMFKLSLTSQFSGGADRAFQNETTAILARVLASLRHTCEETLRNTTIAAAVTLPHVRISDDLMKAACQAADIRYIQIKQTSYTGEPLTYHENSLLAAHDFGLCQPYTTRNLDCVEKQHLQWDTYYFVGYYSHGIEVMTTSDTMIAYSVTPYFYTSFALGSDSRNRNPDEKYYWEEVRDFLSQPLAEFPHRKPRKVIFYGDSSGDEKFREIVKEVLERFLTPSDMPSLVEDQVDPVFAAAVGAAEFAKREPFWNKA